MRIMETKVYTFNELSDKAKAKAIEKNRDISTDCEWYEFTYDDCKKMMEFLGFSDIDINFSGFSSQGDGACFMGNYRYNAEWAKQFADDGLECDGFMDFGIALQEIQERYDGQIMASITKSDNHYSHENTVSIDIFHNENDGQVSPDDENSMAGIMRNMMREIYSLWEADYDYQTSDEAISEMIIANEYEFTEEGTMI